jgi:hypothetical protein
LNVARQAGEERHLRVDSHRAPLRPVNLSYL